MAIANTTSNNYLSYTAEMRATLALEMADELKEQNERMVALAISIRNQLAPKEDGNSDNFTAFRLAELLEEVMGNTTQHDSLRSCLEAMQPVTN